MRSQGFSTSSRKDMFESLSLESSDPPPGSMGSFGVDISLSTDEMKRRRERFIHKSSSRAINGCHSQITQTRIYKRVHFIMLFYFESFLSSISLESFSKFYREI